MSAYTAGPWTWLNYPNGRKMLAAPMRAVIHCPYAPMMCEPADQAILSAAPELYEALNALVFDVDTAEKVHGLGINPDGEAMQAARAALAKADVDGCKDMDDDNYQPRETALANAAIMSAAPELYIALKGMLSHMESWKVIETSSGDMARSRAALAKADGAK